MRSRRAEKEPIRCLDSLPFVGEHIYVGNAGADARTHRGWLLGHFRNPEDARFSTDVEVKWAVHARGDQRAEWVENETRTAVLLLISGRFRVELPEHTVILAEQGDYIVFSGIDHSWYAEEDTVLVAVRWPSIPGYSSPGDSPSLAG